MVAQRKLAAISHFAWHSPDSGSRIDVTLGPAPFGRLWRVWLTDAEGRQKELAAWPAVEGGEELSERGNQALQVLMAEHGRQWVPIDIGAEQSRKRERGPRFDDYWSVKGVRDDVIGVLSSRGLWKQYEQEEPGTYEYVVDAIASDLESAAKFFGVPIPEEGSDDWDWLEDKVQDAAGSAVAGAAESMGLPGQLSAEWREGEFFLVYFWTDEDVEDWEPSEPPKGPEEISVVDPQAETDRLLEEWKRTNDPELKAEIERQLSRLRRLGFRAGWTWRPAFLVALGG